MKKSKRVGRADIWLDEAKYDFDTCHELHTLGRFNWVCTCSQQVGEKAIKSLFLLNGVDYPWTHSIVDLLDELGNQAPYKYYDSKRSEECLKNARRLLEWVRKQIP